MRLTTDVHWIWHLPNKQTNNSERQPAFWLKTNLKSTVFLNNPRHHLSRPWSSPLRGTATNDFNYSGLTKTSSVYSMCFENYCFFSMTSIKELDLHSQRDAFAHWSNTLKVYFSKKKLGLFSNLSASGNQLY